MNTISCADTFLKNHRMHPEQYPLHSMVRSFREEMSRALRGEASSLGMFPAYLSPDGEHRREEPVLVIDAGGTNLRTARVRYTAGGKLEVEALRRSRMPGTRGAIDAEEMFRAIAREALAVCGESRRACISFSYPCVVLPDGDGRMVRLTKELQVRGLVGSLICAPLEQALRELGAPGERRWQLINDTVAAMLCGIAEQGYGSFDGFAGLILGTGTNTCCAVSAGEIRKAPEAAARSGDMLVNLESGGLDKLPMGDADRILDAASDSPGAQRAEKMIAGGYYPQLLRAALLLAAEDGLLPDAAVSEAASLTPRDVDRLLLSPEEGGPFASLPAERQAFIRRVNELLLDRAARITAAILAAIFTRRPLPRGSRVCVCADGTTIQKNPLLLPRTKAHLRELLTPWEVSAEFFFVTDATLLGSAWAGLAE